MATSALRDKGVSDKVMKLAGRQLEDGKAAVFVLADDDTANQIVSAVSAAGIEGVEAAAFPAETQKIVKEVLKVEGD